MSAVTKRPLALADLAEIWSFIADDSEASADRFLSKLEAKLQLLATQAHRGAPRPAKADRPPRGSSKVAKPHLLERRLREELMPGLRSFPYARYVVFFMAERHGIEIVRVVHSARDIVADDFG